MSRIVCERRVWRGIVGSASRTHCCALFQRRNGRARTARFARDWRDSRITLAETAPGSSTIILISTLCAT